MKKKASLRISILKVYKGFLIRFLSAISILTLQILTISPSYSNQNEEDIRQAPCESLYLHTNGHTFLPGDTLWFKAYNWEFEKLRPSELSQFLNIGLFKASGDLILNQKHKLENGLSDGDLILPDSLIPGSYLLKAYSNYTNPENSESVFYKRIKLLSENEIQLKLNLEDSIFSLGDQVKGSIEAIGVKGSRLGKVKIQMQLLQGESVVKKLNLIIGNEGIETFKIKIPDELTQETLILTSTLNHSQLTGISSIYIPLKEIPPSIQFFPEGGDVISGISSIIAFKALDPLGNPFDFSGEIIRPDGTMVNKVSSQFLGMGKFNLAYQASDSLKLQIIHPLGHKQLYDLPIPLENGYTFELLESKINEIRISVNSSFSMPDGNLKVIVQIRGKEYFSKTIKLDELKNYAIPTQSFPIGIAQITILDSKGIPKTERLVFVNQERKLNIKITKIKSEYKSKDKVEIEVDVTDQQGEPAPSLLSMSVHKMNDNELPEWNHNLMSTLLLKSDLKGEILFPGFYFSDQPGAKKALDLLMLTQGWRRFNTKKITTKSPLKSYGLSGSVTRKNGKPVKNASLVLFNSENYGVINTSADKMGKFSFNGQDFASIATANKLVLSATTQSENPHVHLLLNQDQTIKINPNITFENLKTEAQKTNYLAQQRKLTDIENEDEELPDFNKESILLEGVTITARKKVIFTEEVYTKQFASKKVSGDELSYYVSGGTRQAFLDMMRKVAGHFKIENGGKILFRGNNHVYASRNQGAAIVLNEQLVGFDYREIMHLDPAEFESIEVFKSAAAALKYTPYGLGGLIRITLKKGFTKEVLKEIRNTKSSNIESIPGFKVAREFYSPVYTNDKQKQSTLDLRNTLFWEPNLIIDKSGKARVQYFNSDIKANFLIQIEGINPLGHIGYSISKYKVVK